MTYKALLATVKIRYLSLLYRLFLITPALAIAIYIAFTAGKKLVAYPVGFLIVECVLIGVFSIYCSLVFTIASHKKRRYYRL